MADEGFHEIQLSGKHLVALFMAATVVAVVIFLCGVMVGRGVRAQRAAETAALADETPVDPTARPQAETEEPTPSPSSTSGAASPEDVTYPDRLTSGSEAPEVLKSPAELGEPAPPRQQPVDPTRSTRPALTRAVEAPASSPAASKNTPPAPKVPSAPGEPRGNGFAVQVAAVRERAEADTIARQLSRKGYSAYVMTPASGAARVFRVRVGKFKERREAERVAGRLEKEEQFKPWVTR